MALPLSSKGKKKAVWYGVLLGGLLAGVFALGNVPFPQADSAARPAAPASVFSEPEVTLPRTSPESRAVTLIQAGKSDEARRLLETELAQTQDPATAGRLRFLLAKVTPDITAAAPLLENVASSDHTLKHWARLRLAERMRDKNPAEAAKSAELLITEPMFRARAEQLLALSLYEAGKPEEAEPYLRALVAEAPAKSAAMAYAMPLATILAAKPDLASQKEALALYRRVQTRAPTHDEANVARAAAAGVLANMPSAQRIALASLTADEAFAEADALNDARQFARAADAYSEIAKRFKGDQKMVCDARLSQGKALASASRRDKALIVFEDIVRLCPKSEHQTAGRYHAGRTLLRTGRGKEAINHYDAIARDYPASPLADDALLAAAVGFIDLGDVGAAKDRLRQLLALGTRGDMRPDARFTLAWLERGQKNHSAALTELDQHIAEGTGEDTEDIIGRAAYWRARTLLDMERRDEAEDAFAALVEARPFSYYAQQALARLEEIDTGRSATLMRNLRDDTPRDRKQPLRLEPLPELQRPEALRAKDLLRVAEPSPAVEELESMGCFAPSARDELFLMCAAMLQEFGADGPATTLARRRVQRVMSTPPKGPTLALWRVVFPRAYRPLLDDIARKADLSPAFVRAIAREESSFNPRAVSPANAYGLIQLIRPTARTYAQTLNLPSDPESLKNPEINLRIGTSFMRSLFDRYKGNFALVPAAYNAGPGAADKWLRERGNLPLDEWVETIPYNETRRYTRRVLQSYGVYAWLDEGRVPVLSKALREESAPPTQARAETRTRTRDDDAPRTHTVVP
jgi:soluble lytic murein transglycosylase